MKLNDVIAIDFQYSWLKLKQSLKWGILVAAIALLVSPFLIRPFDIEDSYRATATLYSFAESDTDDTMLGLNAIRLYSEMIKSKKVSKEAAELLSNPDLTADKIYDMISTNSRYTVTSTYRYLNEPTVISIYADSTDPYSSIAVANAVADAFVSEINILLGSKVVKVLDYADQTEVMENKGQKQVFFSACIMLAAGLLTLACFVLRGVLSSRIQTMTDLGLYGQIPVLGVLPETKDR